MTDQRVPPTEGPPADAGALPSSRAPLPFVALRGDAAFRRVRERGRAGRSPLLTLRWMPQKRPEVRVGIVVSKKVGKAVVRNRVRRRLREAVRRLEWPPCQVMIVAQPDAARATWDDLVRSLRVAAAKSGLQ